MNEQLKLSAKVQKIHERFPGSPGQWMNLLKGCMAIYCYRAQKYCEADFNSIWERMFEDHERKAIIEFVRSAYMAPENAGNKPWTDAQVVDYVDDFIEAYINNNPNWHELEEPEDWQDEELL